MRSHICPWVRVRPYPPIPIPIGSISIGPPRLGRKARVAVRCSADELDYKVLTSVTSQYNNIVILDTPDSRVLLLDSSNNVHSILHKRNKWTDAYWDEFATLPPIVPRGPIAIFGLGGATAAHLMLELWPSLQLVGWEIDEILIAKAREYLGLSDLEEHTEGGGILEVHIGDVFSPSVAMPGGYAGIIVDLFSDGKVLPQLQEVTTWLEMTKMLMPNGRLMVNCGAATKEWSNTFCDLMQPEISKRDDPLELNTTINALCKAFPGQVGYLNSIRVLEFHLFSLMHDAHEGMKASSSIKSI